jgi:type III secretion protein C
MRARVAFAVLALVAVLAPAVAEAAEIPWRTDNFNYVAQNKPLKDLIRELAAGQGVHVVIAPEVEGTVNGKFNLTPQSMLELLATSFGLTWYYDGAVLYFYPAGEMKSEVVQLGATSPGQLDAALKRMNIADKRYPIGYDRAHNTARIAGPSRFVELVKQTVRALNQGDPMYTAAPGSVEIRVFPLRYAWAADFVFTQGGRDHRLPGVASVLRELYTPTAQGGANVQTIERSSAASRQIRLNRMRGLGYFSDDQLAASSSGGPGDMAPVEQMVAPVAASGPQLPQFQPDGRMNAVIVRDRAERMASYDALIRSLDVKPGLVEIEARIIEVSSDAVSSLGIDWRLHSGSADFQFSRGNLPALGPGSALSEGAPVAGSNNLTGVIPNPGITPPIPSPDLQRGGVLTTLLGDSGRYLIARVNALAQEGKANVLASPQVLTLDNVEAVLENLSTFFVRVSGNLDVGLYDVSSGTSLRVTPLIVMEDGHRQVKLAVRIEDGNISNQSVDQIPIIQRSTIDTQAFIKEGQSLLIGGYHNEVRRDTQVGVPGLSAVPVFGRLFKFKEKQTSHVQRMFLLTPRIVEPE